MSVVSLMKPSTVGSTQNPTSSSGFGRAGSKFKIKVGAFTLGGRCPIEDVTGDGDSGFTPAEGMPVDSISLLGWAPSSAGGMGIANLGDSSGALDLLLSSSNKVSGTLFLQNYRVQWRRYTQFIPLALAGVFSGRAIEGTA
jgi:hypothetical protein